MIEFFKMCWQWILDNKDNITAFFTSTTFIAVMTAILTIIRDTRTKKKNTLSLDKLSTTIASNNEVSGDVKNIKETSGECLNELHKQEEEVTALRNKVSEMENSLVYKLDAMMEVMSIVYSTIKDDTIRNSVNSVLINAKHAGDVSKAQLEQQIELLKKELQASAQSVNEKVLNTVEKLKTAVVGTNTEDNNISRY